MLQRLRTSFLVKKHTVSVRALDEGVSSSPLAFSLSKVEIVSYIWLKNELYEIYKYRILSVDNCKRRKRFTELI